MMSKVPSTEKSRPVTIVRPWDLVVVACLQLVAEHEAAAARFRISMEYFDNRKKSGDPFPGIEKLRERGLMPEAAERVYVQE
jgi:hypothetical protein